MAVYQHCLRRSKAFQRIVALDRYLMSTHRKLVPFSYMLWAKEQALGGARHHLGASGLAPPPEDLVELAQMSPQLGQQGRDMPPALRRGLASRWGVPPAQLMLTLGTSHAMYLLCASRLKTGDRCIVEHPSYEMLHRLPGLFGAEVERFERDIDDGWRLPADLGQRIRRDEPSMVLLSNPHNPSGALLQLEDLQEVADACRATGTLLVVDEVYLPFEREAAALSACQLGEHVVVASSLTKAFGLGTVRCGWLVARPDIIDDALQYNDYISVLYPNPSAWVGVRALARWDALVERAERIRTAGLETAQRWVSGRSDVRWHTPDTGVVGFLRLLSVPDSGPFCDRLLTERSTLLVPGRFFEAPGFVRLGFGCEPDALAAGLEQLGEALAAV